MSASSMDPNVHIDNILTRVLPGRFKQITLCAMLIGLASLAYGFISVGAAWTWGAYLVGLVFILALGQGALILSTIFTATWARWGRPIKRIAETMSVILPVGYLLLIVFLIFGINLYPWHADTILETGVVNLEPHSLEAWRAKPIWLTKGFFIGRQLVLLGLLILLDFFYVRASLTPDLILAKNRLGDRAPKFWDRLISTKETDMDAIVSTCQKRQTVLAPAIIILYAFIFSFMAFDLIMSLSPWWYANMFGAWFFASSFWVGMASLGLVSMIGRDWLGLKDVIKPKVTHDLGKLLLAFCMFWAYTTFAMILPIWYANMPEETDFLLIRMALPQWSWLSGTVGVMCFLAPFTILTSRGIKKMRWPFAGICALIMVGIFLERSLLVMPSVYFGDTFPMWDFILVNVGTIIGFVGLFGFVVGTALEKLPSVVLTDPKMEDHPWEAHIHSMDQTSSH